MVTPQVQLIGWTDFRTPPGVDWQTDADGGAALAEFAGRSCYQAWDKKVPATASNAGYLRHILQVGHLSVLEHASATFYLTGISRALAAELSRHRHFSFSELSPRHLAEVTEVVEPTAVAADPTLHEAFLAGVAAAEQAHHELLAGLAERYADSEQAGLRRKQLRQAARTLLPGATATTLVITGNLRAWRQLIGMRAAEHADRELRTVVIECLRQLRELVPPVFADFVITRLPDSSELASSPLVIEQ
ncbi:MAG: FAD-dependent thymidylate synthase [Jatrophihabitantaceae bacterium]